jgi:glycosyltransferase involved in cell wall biosynthesis
MISGTPRLVVHAAENIRGGVGTYLRDLVIAQRDSYGRDAVIAVVPETQADVLQAPVGVEVITYDNRGPRWLSTLRLARCVREVVVRTNPSVIHLHSTFAGLLRPVLRGIGAPIVYCAHGWSFDRETSALSRRFARTLERALAGLCESVVCISAHETELARKAGIPREKLLHIGNGIPREAPLSGELLERPVWPAGKRRVLFVGRFDRQKGVDILTSALAELRDTAFAYLVGDSVLGDTAALDLPDNVRTTGWLSGGELSTYFETADVLVVPSRWEGFGLIAAEAMRARLPVIATRVGGLPEIVEHGVTGLLVPPDDRQAIVDAIRSLDDRQLHAMGQAGRHRFLHHFTLERAHAQLTALYQGLIAGRVDTSHPAPIEGTPHV